MKTHSKTRLLTLLIVLISMGVVACDPLGTDAQAIVLQITATPPPRTRAPTVTPLPTDSPTATQPTLAPTPSPFACADTAGQVIDDSFVSKVTKAKVNYRVYLPPCYWSTGRRYPSVILMHGSDADETEWTKLLKINLVLDEGIKKGTLAPMILIMPDGGEIANTNVFRENASFETVLLKELMPTVENSLCTWNAREGRAIGGISRGGFWAFLVAFRHADLFSAVGGHSPFFDKNNAPPDFNPLDLAKNVKFTAGEQPRIYINAGKDDYARPNIEVFQKSLSARNIDPGYILHPIGAHNVQYWASHVSDYLEFYGKTWPRHIEDLPSCLQ